MRLGGPDFVFHLPGWGNIEALGAEVVKDLYLSGTYIRMAFLSLLMPRLPVDSPLQRAPAI